MKTGSHGADDDCGRLNRKMPPPVLIPIYFDYASTLCYIAWRIVRELEPELGFAALWKGVPIRNRDRRAQPGNSLGEFEQAKVLSVVVQTGIEVTPPERWANSDAALEGSELARDAGVFAPYHEGVFRACFEHRSDISQLDVLADIASAAGMDGGRFRDEISTGRMRARIEANRSEADRFSALGYPTFMLGEFPLTGIQPAETMRMVLGRFIERRRREPQA